jgi:hypothetical protein
MLMALYIVIYAAKRNVANTMADMTMEVFHYHQTD